MQITSNIPEFTINEFSEFTLTVVAENDLGKNYEVYYTPISEIVTIEYLDQDTESPTFGQWFPLGDIYGPSTIKDKITRLRAKFSEIGTFGFALTFIDTDANKILGVHTVVVNVYGIPSIPKLEIAKFKLYPEDEPTGYAVGFNVTTNNGRTFYRDVLVPLDEVVGLEDDRIVNVAWTKLKDEIMREVQRLEAKSLLLGRTWTPPEVLTEPTPSEGE